MVKSSGSLLNRLAFLRGLILILAVVVAFVYLGFSREVRLGLDLKGGTQLTLQALPTEEVTEITSEVMQGVEAVIQQRINGLGVAEPLVQISGQDRLFVQLPGVADPDRAIALLGDTAQLEFRKGLVPANTLPRNELGEVTAGEDPDALFEHVGLTGDLLRNAYPQAPRRGSQNWEVLLEFKPEGAEKFTQLTRDLAGTGRPIGIFLDDVLISAPVVGAEFARTGITGGTAVITGNFSVETANDLAVKLKAGALPARIQVIENRTVGATLGEVSVRQSLYAGIGGIVLVFIFMVAYYRLPGLIADVALLIYALCTFALFQLLGVTMTLPGIAGFILSIGMAVDANVLIFERIKEELREGKSLYKSISEGFNRAFSSILDSNITTLLVCGVLFWLGIGLVKGFAVTLGIGILVSFFTALTCTRTLLLAAMGIPSLRKPQFYGVRMEVSQS
ncbi:protein translocase subunit SecD [Thermostichus vulcanus]|uniref:Protein translocase subunit SecD n=1 Tax=Thermostichus vulcanus str. 'Rupite' TaxID=2813851 RepID=A0ABT0C7Y5_THEVL|nr:protein translocase subunit SecD [Thermostichus vulcanus]MCJ2541899.1 protein translocase subunit SecD [Thermostichus vulcanus str. 'Rupite']